MPADGVAKAILRRLRLSGKQAPPALTEGIATGVRVIKEAEDAADSGAGSSLRTFDIAGADTPPGGDVKAPMVKPNKFFDASHLTPVEGYSWISLDPLRMDRYAVGVSVDFSLGSIVQGSVGLFKADFGEWIM